MSATGPREFEAAHAALALAQSRSAAPVLLWGEDSLYRFALIAPLKFAPGRRERWLSWGLAAAVAAYRQFGVPAYFDGELFLHGNQIAQSHAALAGECALICSSFLAHFPGNCVATPSSELEQAFRQRLEAQHGWEFDHSWPTELECVAATSS